MYAHSPGLRSPQGRSVRVVAAAYPFRRETAHAFKDKQWLPRLVHEAYHGAWGWEKLAPELEHRGHQVLAVDLSADDPQAGAAEYAAAALTAFEGVGDDRGNVHDDAWRNVLGERKPSPSCGRSKSRLERFSYLREELGLFTATGDLHALELAAEPDIGVEVARILVEVKERPGSPREIAPLPLPQLG
jgi:hypothetical protein